MSLLLRRSFLSLVSTSLASAALLAPLHAGAQNGPPQTPIDTSGQKSPNTSGLGDKNSNTKNPKTGTDKNSESKPASAGESAASTRKLRLGPLDPSTPPLDLPTDRPAIGLAMGGGGALAMSEIGVIRWLEEHHIPVDVIAGTSMGSILSALYSTGKTPEQMSKIMTNDSVNNVFRIESAYRTRNFRRREDSREIPNSVTVGLKHGAALRNSLLTDTGLNELLDKEFLNYNDQTDFNTLPIPFRCQATDLNAAKTVTFSRGSLQDAVRASASIPGVFRPFELDGHEFVDGAILQNLPTPEIQAMNAKVIIAISLPLDPVGKGDLDSIVGVLQRAFAVGIESNEARDRKLADVVIMPDIKGFTANDYLKTKELSDKGYAAAEAHKDELMKYSVSQEQWDAYLLKRLSKERGKAGTILQVKISAPNDSVKEAARRGFADLPGKPVDTVDIEDRLAELRGSGRYDTDYTVGYDSTDSNRPIILVTVRDKKTGPPFLDLGLNIQAQTGGITQATVSSILVYQGLGGYGSEARAKFDFGYLTRVEGEYYKRLGWNGFFAAPRASVIRKPYYIYQGNTRVSQRQSQFVGPAFDLGYTENHRFELRAGYEFNNVQWDTVTGFDGLQNYHGNMQKIRVRTVFDTQDRALVPQYGFRFVNNLGYLYGTDASPSAPQLQSQFQYAHAFKTKNIFLANVEGGTMLNRNVAEPFRFTLGGPLRLSATATDELRGTDYFLVTPGVLHRLATLPAPLGQSIYVGATYEAGKMYRPDGTSTFRQDVYFGLVAETPFGVVTAAPSIGNNGERKFIFTLGKLF